MSVQISEETRAQIRKVLSLYKENFAGWIPHELYKWRAVAWFRQRWDLNAADLPAMLKDALSKTDTLFNEAHWYPRGTIVIMAKAEPETVREMLARLLDENQPLPERVRAFKDSAAQLWKRCRGEGKSYHDDKTACRYLFFVYPEKYFLYQYGKYAEFAYQIGLTPEKWSVACGCAVPYMDLASQVAEAVREDSDLVAMLNAKLDGDCYRDEACHLLADDVSWYVKKLREMPYWPAEDDYSPGIDAEKWRELLQNPDVCNQQRLKILMQMLFMGGEATCTQLKDRFGGSVQYYITNMASLAQAVHKYTDCPLAAHEDNERKYWPILFTGRTAPGSQPGAYSWKLREELSEALESLEPIKPDYPEKENDMDIGKNTILYGPPGTGKTYNTVNYAVAVIEGKPLTEIQSEKHDAVLNRFRAYREAGRIAFVTFHQSYGYEDFIEGIRPALPDEGEVMDGLSYELADGAFKKFCNCAEYATNVKVWEVRWDSYPWEKNDCIKNGRILRPLEMGKSYEQTNRLFEKGMNLGDIVLAISGEGENSIIEAIGIITGTLVGAWIHAGVDGFFRKVRWLETNLSLSMQVWGVQLLHDCKLQLLKQGSNYWRRRTLKKLNYVFIIDEINRGNISKIFGELITLIEPEKRKGKPEYVPVKLTCSQSEFGVPDNVWILGTMNTADRSIALLDTALRRRFQFREIMPDSRVLEGITVQGVAVSGILDTLNRRIEALYDREHTLGHAWFLPLRDDSTVERLGKVFRDSVIPLLQEYFYDDYEKIRLVLGDEKRKKAGQPQFFKRQEPDALKLFGADVDFPLNASYCLNPDTLINIEAYQNL